MITGYLLGDKETIAKLQSMYPNMRDRLTKTVDSLALRLLAHVKQDKLSGQVLKNRTGNLRSHITKRLQITPTSVIGTVGTNISYAAYHEYGFHGIVTVREHLRRAKAGMAMSTVRAHTRNVNYPAHSFLRTALADMAPQIKSEISQSLTQAARDTLKT